MKRYQLDKLKNRRPERRNCFIQASPRVSNPSSGAQTPTRTLFSAASNKTSSAKQRMMDKIRLLNQSSYLLKNHLGNEGKQLEVIASEEEAVSEEEEGSRLGLEARNAADVYSEDLGGYFSCLEIDDPNLPDSILQLKSQIIDYLPVV